MSVEVARVVDRVFESVLAPLVLGGAMRPARPIGARAALALIDAVAAPSDADLASRVELARVRSARRLAAIDRVDDPSGATWTLGAALHDLLQVANPGWMRRSGPRHLLELVVRTLDRVPPVATAHDALMRHAWFERLFAIVRTDVTVSWWTGTRDFLGREPPGRLLAWPDLRRVHVARAPRGLMDLLSHGGATEEQPAFARVVSRFLRATPLTDLASVAREAPEFAWSDETLALARSPVARVLALRAVARANADAADAALGRATRALLAAKTWGPATTALDFLGHRALAAAQSAHVLGSAGDGGDAGFARAAGAIVARKWIAEPQLALPDAERRRLAPILDGAARGSVAREIAELVAR